MKSKEQKKGEPYVPKYIGKNYDEVSRELRADKIPFRVTKEDGQYYVITRDLKLDRFNFEIKNGIIVGEYLG